MLSALLPQLCARPPQSTTPSTGGRAQGARLPSVSSPAPSAMRLALCSDLHVDTWPEHPLCWDTFESADCLVVAGDVHDDLAGTVAELEKAAARYPAVVWVDGNHEAFQHGADLGRSAEAAKGAPVLHRCSEEPADSPLFSRQAAAQRHLFGRP